MMDGKEYSFQRIAVVGAGAVGAYYGCLLQQSGKEVHILARSDYAVAKEHGYELRRGSGIEKVQPASVQRDPRAIGPVDLVIVALKATAAHAYADLIAPLVGPHTLILTLQNGLGNIEALENCFGTGRVIGGLCFVCLNRIAPAVIENYLPGHIVLGELRCGRSPRLEALVACFRQAGVRIKAAPSFDQAAWRKLCWNIPFNGLAIVNRGMTTDRIIANPSLAREARALMEEIRRTAAAMDIDIPVAHLDQQFVVTARMGAYRPSSMIDYIHGYAVETEAIFGEPLRRAQALGVECPHLTALYRFVRAAVEERPQSTKP